MEDFDVSVLFERGEVLENVPGETYEQIYDYICGRVSLPTGLSSADMAQELVQREKVLSTAVGNGIAIPHPRRPLVKISGECKVIVAYLRAPVDMQAPDARKVYVMFILLSDSSQFHIKALSSLAALFKNEEFRRGLQTRPSKSCLLELVKKNSVKDSL